MRYEPRLSRAALACAVVGAMALAPALARDAFADSPHDQARSHYLKGKGLYDQGDYKAASAWAAERLGAVS